MASGIALIIKQNLVMDLNQAIPCPNCGNVANRRHFTSNKPFYHPCQGDRIIQTECPVCDYLMVMCSLNGRVIEAHSSCTSPQTKQLISERPKPSKVFPLRATQPRPKFDSGDAPLLKPLSA